MTERAVGYIRVSTSMQVEDGVSIETQEYEMRRYCEQQGWELVTIYTDEGKSAYRDDLRNRPQLDAAMTSAERGEFEVLLVRDQSRLARKLRVSLALMARLADAGVRFDAVMEHVDEVSPEGRLSLHMKASLAEYQSAQTGQRVLEAGRHRARAGQHAGLTPFCVPEAVVECFERRVRGQSYAEIATWMNLSGHSTQRGNSWGYEAIRDLIANPYYRGVVTYEGTEYPGQHSALVTDEMWFRAQGQKRKRAPKSVPGTRGLLQGRAFCVRCHHLLHSDQKRPGHYQYRERHRDECETRGRTITASGIDRQLGEIFGTIRIDGGVPHTGRAMAARSSRPHGAGATARLERAGELYLEGRIGRARYDSIVREAEQVAEAPVDLGRVARCRDLMGDLPRLWSRLPHQGRYEITAELIDTAYIDVDEGTIGAIVPVKELDWLMEQALESSVGLHKVALVEMRGHASPSTPPLLWPSYIGPNVWHVAA